MSKSRRLIKLERRVNIIESTFLPPARPSGNYSKKEQDIIRAFLLLTHAEIEAYFEEICEEKVKRAFKNWKLNRTKSNVLISLVSFISLNNDFNNQSIEERVNKSLTIYCNALSKNHGIKEKNILSMLLPIGVELSEIDTTWLNTINSFGTSRGEIAHTAAHVQQPLDPVTLRSTVQQILSEVVIIDEKIKIIR